MHFLDLAGHVLLFKHSFISTEYNIVGGVNTRHHLPKSQSFTIPPALTTTRTMAPFVSIKTFTKIRTDVVFAF
jgi:hypothetical protein